MNDPTPANHATQRRRRVTLRGAWLTTAVIVFAVLVLAAVYFAWASLLMQGPRRPAEWDPPAPAQRVP